MTLRRYTPPTCTLEINAKDSSLSEWAGKPVLKQLEFQLRFDDPRYSEDKQVTILGNHQQLEDLHAAVSKYVQDFLEDSTSPMSLQLESITNDVDALPSVLTTDSVSEPESTPSRFVTQIFGDTDAVYGSEKNITAISPRSPYLRPKGLITHDLFLGSLATDKSGDVVSLSVLQLFDLATALDEYATELLTLPTLKRPFWLKTSSVWIKAVALVVATVGVTAVVMKLLEPKNPAVQIADQNTDTLSSPSPLSTELPIPGLNPAPQPLSPLPPLATPTTPQSPLSNSTIPGVKPQNSNSMAILTPPPGVGVSPLPTPNNSSTQPQLNPQSVSPYPIKTNPLSQPLRERTTTQNRLQDSPSKNSFRISSSGPRFNTNQSFNRFKTSQSGVPMQILPLPTPSRPAVGSRTPNIKPKKEKTLRSNVLAASPQDIANQFPEISSNPTTSLPSGIGLSDSRFKDGGIPITIITPPVLKNPNQTNTNSNNSSTTNTGNVATGTAFDTIPQVKEVREYFQSRWKPPQSLKQSLEYTLLLSADGSIDRIIPLGPVAGVYIDRTSMPRPGDRFVSPTDAGQNAQIRLVLGPNGNVQTFLEKTNK